MFEWDILTAYVLFSIQPISNVYGVACTQRWTGVGVSKAAQIFLVCHGSRVEIESQ